MDRNLRRRADNRRWNGAKVKAGDVVTMAAGCRHTIIADTNLQVIEVQLGKEISVHDKHKYELES